MSFFPMTKSVDAVSFNWNILIYGATVVFALIYYWIWGTKVYKGPVVLVRKEE